MMVRTPSRTGASDSPPAGRTRTDDGAIVTLTVTTDAHGYWIAHYADAGLSTVTHASAQPLGVDIHSDLHVVTSGIAQGRVTTLPITSLLGSAGVASV